MALADRVDQIKSKGPGIPCSVGTLLETLEPDDAATLRQLLGTKEQWGEPAQVIFDVLRAEGHRVSFQTINRHRGEKCRCFA